MALVTLADTKTYLGISGNSYDVFLQSQIDLLSEVVENYCGRKFASATYVQTYYWQDFVSTQNSLSLFHYPASSITSVEIDGVALAVADFRAHLPSGVIYSDQFKNKWDTVEITYVAGFSTIPLTIQTTIYDLVGQRYNKHTSGVALNFGSDVQRVSIPGTISIDFDYSLTTNERSNAFGSILGSSLNALDFYRSERRVSGSGKVEYVA